MWWVSGFGVLLVTDRLPSTLKIAEVLRFGCATRKVREWRSSGYRFLGNSGAAEGLGDGLFGLGRGGVVFVVGAVLPWVGDDFE